VGFSLHLNCSVVGYPTSYTYRDQGTCCGSPFNFASFDSIHRYMYYSWQQNFSHINCSVVGYPTLYTYRHQATCCGSPFDFTSSDSIRLYLYYSWQQNFSHTRRNFGCYHMNTQYIASLTIGLVAKFGWLGLLGMSSSSDFAVYPSRHVNNQTSILRSHSSNSWNVNLHVVLTQKSMKLQFMSVLHEEQTGYFEHTRKTHWWLA
jgi:hypothetical protein